MKLFYSLLGLSIFLVSCQPKADNSANEAFEKNSQTVMANLKGFESENVDYSQYAADFVMRDTGFGAKDSLSLDEVKKSDKEMWATFDFKMVTEPNLLPGVDADTKMPDGSVRHYSDWKVTLPATDSTEARSGVIKLYESFDFDKDGKIIYQQVYGDFGGLMRHLFGHDEDGEDDMD
ncbi:hypothetical protein ACS386_10065 [Flavobacteriaceae bacterium LMO-SS05]